MIARTTLPWRVGPMPAFVDFATYLCTLGGGVLRRAGHGDAHFCARRGLQAQRGVAEIGWGEAAVNLVTVDRDGERVALCPEGVELEVDFADDFRLGEGVFDPGTSRRAVRDPGGGLVVVKRELCVGGVGTGGGGANGESSCRHWV